MTTQSGVTEPICPACAGSALLPFARIRGVPIVRCPSCGMRLVHPLPRQSEVLGLYSMGYFEGGGHGYRSYLDDEATHRRIARKRLVSLLRHAQKGCLLDVGCAAGFFLEEARRVGFEVRGVDVCCEMVELARERYGLDVETGELTRCRAPDGSLDVITFFQVLAHLHDPLPVLQRAHKLLRPGGLLVVETWNADSLAARGLGRRWPLYNPPSVLYYLGSRSLPRLLERAGFQVVSSQRGSKTISIREAASMLRNQYPGRFFGALAAGLSRRIPGAGLGIPLGMSQLLTVFGRRRE